MTGEYNIKVKPLEKNARETNWRNANTLSAELILDIDGEKKHFSGTLKRDD